MSGVPPPGLSSSLRTLLGSGVELLKVRLELVTVEAREEILRLGALVVYGAFAIVFLALGLGFLAILLTVLLWDSHRLVALAVFTSLFLGAGLVAAWLARERVREGSHLFAATREELQQDIDRLRP